MSAPGGAPPFERVGIVGCGLIGGSLALAAGSRGGASEVVVTDRDPGVRRRAAGRGVGTVVDGVREVARRCDLVIVAVPVPAIVSVAREAGKHMDMHAVLTDVGSTKAAVVRELTRTAGSGEFFQRRFVGGHPMSGSEREGLEAADATLFEAATYVLTPQPTTDADALQRLGSFLRRLGARVLTVDAGEHDRLVAVVSHLPQLVSSALMRFAGDAAREDRGLMNLAGGGFRDVTRVAGSNPELWLDILKENRGAVAEAMESFDRVLEGVRRAIVDGDWAAVRVLLEGGREARRLLPRKDVPTAVVDVVVPIPDEPGSLAAVTTALGSAGINIEDVSMRHLEEGGRGVLVVAVDRGRADEARAVLAARGMAAHIDLR